MAVDSESPTPPQAPEAPDWAQSAIWLWHQVQQHGEALLKPPVLLAFLIIGGVSYFFGSSQGVTEFRIKEAELHNKDSELHNKDDRIAFLNDQISAYKDRLQGATPDQAAKEIATLRN